METLYALFRKTGEHRFPFELLEHFDLESVHELGDVASGQLFHEIVLREKQGTPTVTIRRSFHDSPMHGIPTVITIQRNLSFTSKQGPAYCNNYADSIAECDIHPAIKQFLSDDYPADGWYLRTCGRSRKIA